MQALDQAYVQERLGDLASFGLQRSDVATSDLEHTTGRQPGPVSFSRQDIGLLSRHSATRLTRIDTRAPEPGTDRTRGVNKNIVAASLVSQTPVAIVCVDLRSRATEPDRHAPREAQGRALTTVDRGLQHDGWPLIVLGDFNDHDGTEPDVAGNQPITRVLEAIREVDPTDGRRSGRCSTPDTAA